MAALSYIGEAFAIALTPTGLLALVLSVFTGLIFGMLPGLTSTMAVALLTGLTYNFNGPLAIMSLLSIYIGAISGGNQSAILLNIPGTPASAATAMEGYPLALKGKAGLAIFVATGASFFGTIISIVCVALFTPMLTQFALKFMSHEMFLLAVFGVVICGNLTSNGDPLKGWISGFIGLLMSQVGMDTIYSYRRFTYGSINLAGGISLLPVMIGLFGFPEVVKAFSGGAKAMMQQNNKYSVKEGLIILLKNRLNILRSSILGMLMGAIPGVGEDTGGWISYWSEKKVSKTPELWSNGCIDGVVAAEAGNNGAIGGAIIPVLSLAIPGSTSAAVLLAAFWMHGYRPGPLLMQDTPNFLYYVIVFMFLASCFMWFLGMVIARFSVKVLAVDAKILMPIVFVCCVIGAFVVSNRLFDIKLMFVFGLLGIAMSYLKMPGAPFLLGIILGNMADENLRRALLLTHGDISIFFTRPISVFFMLLIAYLIFTQTPFYEKLVYKFKSKR
ncbi:tripartite tricarboxylate transporter permease [Treponema parvum]|uniref:Tripartite tricarboxylate transporter permease n=1 Tax=Treponema parvum TaxID=138851 RepID=A0A975IDA9_9SPIR|nr:tripartite tricarboxylate transporter permease [Treponema parvum]QTQ12642.1 tripartite tricarboxylate transporter permease [Treponema parvum]